MTDSPAPSASEAPPFEAGDLVEGRYLVENLMAATNFSWVYRAVQRSTRQPVVVKVLRTHHVGDASSEEIEQRFRRETSIYARVHHPNVVRLLDTGRHETSLYVVLDYIEGVSLSQVIHDEGRIEPFEAKRLLGQCLGALAVAHEQGIVHRDFKPANVMITSTGTDRNAVLLDFGLAGLEETLRTGVPLGRGRRITSPGMVMGTFWYMPPEVLEGVVSVQSDVFSWGMVAIECLAGERPNPDRGEIRNALTEVRKPIALPDWLARQPLGEVLARATAIDRAERYASAVEALADLRRCPVADLVETIPLPAPRLRRRDTADDDLTGTVQVGRLTGAHGPLSVELAPSMLVAELGQLAERAPMPASPHLGPPIDQDLDALFEDYLQITRALNQNPLITREQLHERALRDAEWLRAALGCRRVRFRLVIDDEHIRLQPVPID